MCTIGIRQQEMHLLCGALLPVFKKLGDLHQGSQFGRWIKKREGGTQKQALRVIKCITSDGEIYYRNTLGLQGTAAVFDCYAPADICPLQHLVAICNKSTIRLLLNLVMQFMKT